MARDAQAEQVVVCAHALLWPARPPSHSAAESEAERAPSSAEELNDPTGRERVEQIKVDEEAEAAAARAFDEERDG